MDKLKIVILPDGTIKSTSDEVSPENHQAAEAFLKMLAGLTGGRSTRQARGDLPTRAGHAHNEQVHNH